MNKRRGTGKTYVFLAILAASCADKTKHTDRDASGEVAGAAGASGSAVEQTEVIEAAGGIANDVSIFAGSVNQPTFTPTGPTAKDTADGTTAISAERAAELLKDPSGTCQGWSVEAEAQPSLIHFVVDVSGSMKESTSTTGGESKWAVTRRALANTIDKLPSNYGVALSFFPNMEVDPSTEARPSSACVNVANDVALAPMSLEQRARLKAALDAIVIEPLGATPTWDAYAIATQRLAATTLPGNRYVVLITDGQPTQGKACVGSGSAEDPQPPDDILTAITQARTQSNITTFVVGSPGSEKNFRTAEDARGWLSLAARAGGTAAEGCGDSGPKYCHFDVTQAADFGTALSGVLTTITQSAMSCVFNVPVPTGDQVLDPSKVNMIYSDGQGGYFLVLPDSVEGCDKGWSYTNGQLRVVQICGKTCSLIQANSLARLSILFGCQEKEIITIL